MSTNTNLNTGTIDTLVRERGFGFIRSAYGKRIFFHAAGVSGVVPYDSLQEGQRVYFETAQNPRDHRERAVCVQLA